MSGRGPRRDAYGVFELVARDTVLVGHDLEVLAGSEQGQRVVQPGATACEDRLPEASGRLDDQLRDLVAGSRIEEA